MSQRGSEHGGVQHSSRRYFSAKNLLLTPHTKGNALTMHNLVSSYGLWNINVGQSWGKSGKIPHLNYFPSILYSVIIAPTTSEKWICRSYNINQIIQSSCGKEPSGHLVCSLEIMRSLWSSVVFARCLLMQPSFTSQWWVIAWHCLSKLSFQNLLQ